MLETSCIDDPDNAIVVESRDVHNLSDKNSVDEDGADKNQLSGNQLRAPAFIESASTF